MDKISIIVPIYNKEKYLTRCISSVLSQTFTNIEVLLINDGSSDKSLDICKKYEKLDNRIIVFDKKNGGVSSARNCGIENASGKYLMFVDADDYLDSNSLNVLYSNIIDKPYLFGVNYQFIINDSIKKSKISESLLSFSSFINKVMTGDILGSSCLYLFEKSKINNLRFDTNLKYMEDSLFLIQYMVNNEIKYINYVDYLNSYYNYYINDGSCTNNSVNIINNIENYIKSLNCINLILNNEYLNEINKKKVLIIESEGRKLKNSDEYNLFINNSVICESVLNYNKSLFCLIFKTRNIYLLKIYYYFRNFLKIIFNIVRR